MTGPSKKLPMITKNDIASMVRSVQAHDHDRIAPPPQVWDNIVAELEVAIASSEAAARRRLGRRWRRR